MAGPVLLPTPLPSSSVLLGQLLVDPFNPEHKSFIGSSGRPPVESTHTQPNYKDALLHDDSGRFITNMEDRLAFATDNILLLHAEQMTFTNLTRPSSAFDALRRSTSSQSFLCKMALRNHPLYYVTGIQKLKNPSFKKGMWKEGSIAEVPASADTKIRLPIHVRRDSALDLEERSSEAVFGLELRKVRCKVGRPEEPHGLEDIEYSWSYHKLDGQDDLQLAIGLGEVLKAAELRALAGIVHDEDYTDESYGSERDDDDEGQGGFESA